MKKMWRLASKENPVWNLSRAQPNWRVWEGMVTKMHVYSSGKKMYDPLSGMTLCSSVILLAVKTLSSFDLLGHELPNIYLPSTSTSTIIINGDRFVV